MTTVPVHLRVPAAIKARWVRESRAAGMRLTDWIVQRVEAQTMTEKHVAIGIPAGLKFSDLRMARDPQTGDVSFDTAVIERICEANGLPADLASQEKSLMEIWQRAIDLEPSAPDQAAEAAYQRAVSKALAMESAIDAQRAALGLPTHAAMRAERDAAARQAAAAEAAEAAAMRAAQEAAEAAERARQEAAEFAVEFAAALPETARRFGDLYDGAGRRVAVIRRELVGEWRTSSLSGQWSGSEAAEATMIVAADGRQIADGEWLASTAAGEFQVRAGDLHIRGAMCTPDTSASSDWLPAATVAALYRSDYEAADAWDAAFADRRAAKAAAKPPAPAAVPEQASPFAALAALKRSV